MLPTRDWIKQQELSICCLQETPFKVKGTYRMKLRGWKKIFHANGNNKKARVAITTVTSDNIDFKTNSVTKDKEEHYVMIKG